MDLPSFINHTRYAPIPPHPPPPPPPSRPSSFPEEPNFHAPPPHLHHQHDGHFPPLARPPPQPQPQPLPPTPTYRPQSYTLYPSQFNFPSPNPPSHPNPNPSPNRPIEDDRSRSSHSHHLHDFSLSPRLSHRLDRPRHLVPELDRLYAENRHDFRESSRIVADDRPTRPYPSLDLDHDSHHRSFSQRTSSPSRRIDFFRHEPENSSTFREEYSDQQHNQREKFVWGRNDSHRRGVISDRSSRSLGFMVDHNSSSRGVEHSSSSRGVEHSSSSRGVEHSSSSRGVDHSSSSRGLESNSGGYASRYGLTSNIGYGLTSDRELGRSGRDALSENQRWGLGRQSLKDGRDSSFEMGHNEMTDGDGGRVFSGKREYTGSESGRYSNTGSRENSHEYVRPPRKQIQKMSAFLRIQLAKPSHRNRDGEHSQYSGYFGDSNSSSFRGKDQLGYSGRRMEDEEPEESPVELDVSFKSNSLVAKAIVTPPISTVVPDTNVTPRSRKIRKVMVSDMDCSRSSVTNFNEGTSRSGSSIGVANNTSSSGRDSIQLEEKVTASGNRTNNLIAKSKVEISLRDMNTDKTGTNVASAKTSSPKIVKKKKVVKKIIKKVMTPRSRLSSSQPVKKCDEPVRPDSFTAASGSSQCLTTLKDDELAGGMTSIKNVDLQPGLNKVSALSESNKVGDSLQVIVSGECGNDIDSVGRNRDVSTSMASSGDETKIDEDPLSADASTHYLHTILNSDIMKSPIESTFSDARSLEDSSKQFCQSGDLILVDNGVEKESQEAMGSAEGNFLSGLLSSEDIKVNGHVMHTYSAAYEMNRDMGFDFNSVSSQEKTTVLYISPVDVICQQLCTNDVPALPNNNIVEECPKAVVTVGSNDIVALSSSVETRIYSEPIHADCFEQGKDSISGSENGWANLEEIATSNNGTSDDVCKQPSSDGVTKSLESDAMKGSPNTKVPVGGSKDDTSTCKKKRKVRTSQLDLSCSKIADEDMGSFNIVSPANAVDTTLCLSINDSNPDEVTVSGAGSLGVYLQPNTSGVSVLNGNSSTDRSSESEVSVKSAGNFDPNVISPKHRKKRKVSVQGPVIADTSKPGAEVILNSSNGLIQQEVNVPPSSVDATCTDSFPPQGKGIKLLLEDNLPGGTFEAVSPVRGALVDDVSRLEQPNSAACSAVEELAIPNLQSFCLPMFGGEQKDNAALVIAVNNDENVMEMESCRREKMNVHPAEEQIVICNETAQSRISLELQSPSKDKGFPSMDVEFNSYLLVKDDLANVPNCQSLSGEGDGISTSNSNELMESLPGALSDIGSPETMSDVRAIHLLNCKASSVENSSKKASGSDRELDQRPLLASGSNISASTSFSKRIQIASDSDYKTAVGHSVTLKTVPLQPQNSKNMSHSRNPMKVELNGMRNQVSNTIPRTFPGHSSFAYTNSKKTVSSTPITKPRTWHRNANFSLSSMPPNKASNIVPQQRQLSGKNGKLQSTSYIRKGNSLVRKPTPVAVQPQGSHVSLSTRLNSFGTDELMKGTGSDRVEVIDPSNSMRTGALNALSERPRTSPLPNGTRFPNLSTSSSGNCTSSPLAEHDLSGCCELLSDPFKCTENGPKASDEGLMRSGTPENQSGPVSNMESQSENMKRITYVKPKSNQLVAASNACDPSVPHGETSQALYSDGYYKRRKNQLIRTPLESHKKADDSSNAEGQKASKVFPSRSFSKRQSDKVVAKTCKPSKFSLVWTLRGTQSSSKDGELSHHEVLPRTPYKRATYWRSFMQNPASISNNSSISLTRKLLLLRKMNTVYTRSKHGFALRKSKVLSIGGSSLKWSKAIERRAKMVNEEATLAVAAVERKRREQNGAAACVLTGTKNKNQSFRKSVHNVELLPGERIFRIGSVRYKMDSSRRTLQRISDDDSSRPAASQSKNDSKKSYVPRRLLIGNDEYVRIGNGNQLVRDPKKRTRALANEKVRWSLHTARLRLARKRKYCQFFTRFGKCNKGDGKCPYIHDPSKIAVCTKFLNGLCSDSNCKLTHKVIPERMPDCSYFLQGLCTNEKCPYRHVNVNQYASTCEDFLKGYCATGDECRKKHSYVCPTFESTGSCPQGSKCKLHHPMKRSKAKKRKQSGEQKNARGRYFGSTHIDSEPGTMVSERHTAQTNNDDILFEGRFADYIHLDFSDDDAGESNDPTNEQRTFSDIHPSDVQLHDLDDLIKPIRIMA